VPETLTQFLKFNTVGIANTLVGFSIIFTLMLLGLSATISNIIGYALGGTVSYKLNKNYTFKSNANIKMRAIRFFTVLFIAYILNFLTLQWLLSSLNPYLAQFIAAIVYTVSSFIMAKIFVFKAEENQ